MSAAEKIKERKKLITDMLNSAPENRLPGADIRKRIKERFGKEISKATLSSDIKALISEGYKIVSDTGGYRLLNPGYLPDKSQAALFEPVIGDTVARWLIMLILSEDYDKFMSAQDIYDKYVQMTTSISMSKLKNHLRILVEQNYITKHTRDEVRKSGQSFFYETAKISNKLYYHISHSAPVLSFIDKEAVMDFNAYFHDGGYESELESTLKKINDKIAAVDPDVYAEGSGVYRSTGKRNDIPEELADKLGVILSLPFREKALNIKYREKDKTREYIFKTALMIFNVETNSFYLLGEIRQKGRWVRNNLKLSAVADISANEKIPNDIYESSKYRDIFYKMWSSAPDEPCETEVLFEETAGIHEEVDALRQARKDTASVTFAQGDDTCRWIRYRDSIMGTHDFLRFVRSMGDGAVIIKPEKSREHLISKTKDMIKEYSAILGEGGHK